MKKILILALLLTTMANAQITDRYTKAFTLGLDTKMLLMGPYEHDKTSAIHAYAQLVLPQSDILEVGLLVNYTNSLDEWTNPDGIELSSWYFNWGIFGNFKMITWGDDYGKYHSKHTVYMGIELTQLVRPKIWYSAGSNIGYRFMFNEHWGIDARFNYMIRPDLGRTKSDELQIRYNGVLSAIYYFDLRK